MAELISAGVSVTVTDDSFFIPSQAATVPLIFIATSSEKLQPNALDPALSTYEYDQVRTVTTAAQSVRNYGVPGFRLNNNGESQHGDSRNEYGLFALNQYLGIGNRAFVIRANINLNDDRDDVLDLWYAKTQASTIPTEEAGVSTLGAAYILESLTNDFIAEYNVANGFIPADTVNYKVTVTETELAVLIDAALSIVFGTYYDEGLMELQFGEATFRTVRPDYVENQTAQPLNVYGNGFNASPTGTYLGLEGAQAEWVTNTSGSVVGEEWTPVETRNFLIANSDLFQYTTEFLNGTSLGENDQARRDEIVKALKSSIDTNNEIRSEKYEYNLILCPGYPEVHTSLTKLAEDIGDEAFIIMDTPMDMDAESVVTWAGTPDKDNSNSNMAYYYPHGLATNLDGREVLCATSGIALRTLTYNDSVAHVWSAPAGTRRGNISGISSLGYFTGTAGTATTFVEANLSTGDQGDLYKDGTNINPMVFKPGVGMLVWGQKTAQGSTSALNRINVARLMCYVKRQLRKNTLSFLFEPNDQLTRDSLKAAVDGFLSDIVIKRGLYDFASVSDATNNTAFRIDNNQMYIDVAIKPTKTAEFLFIPIRIVSTDAEI